MRRLVVLLSAVFVAVFMVSSVALSAQAEPDDRQYEPSDGSETSGDTRESSAPSGDNFVSQGSVSENTPEARAARRDLAVEERLPGYSQVVDNSTKGRFLAPGWKHVSGDDASHGADYAVAKPDSDAKSATFRVKIPTDNDYAVYAWWTAAKQNASAARFAIETASGPHTEKADQTKEGGMWIKLGAFEMKKGERTIRVATSDDAKVVADAVAIVRGEQAALPEESMASAEGDDMMRAASRATNYDIVRQARRYIGIKYRYGACTRYRMSCTCETKRSVGPFGHNLPMTELGQWRYEPSVRIGRSGLRPGDIVFFKERGYSGPITHVGVFSGRGMIVHASSYWGKVVEKQMKYIRGYYGAIRVYPR